MKNLWACEPVVLLGALEAAILCAIGFGVPISGNQNLLLMGLAKAVLVVITRSRVSPVSKEQP